MFGFKLLLFLLKIFCYTYAYVSAMQLEKRSMPTVALLLLTLAHRSGSYLCRPVMRTPIAFWSILVINFETPRAEMETLCF